MPKTIDYPRTSYTSAWEVAEVVDDTGGKCAIETAARKLNRKVSGSFKAIIGSAVKFGLLTSKREFLTTTNLFRRIKHAYDKQEERIYHREAFLHPPLFTQICRKFRNRELPVHMLDVMLLREFGVEEINAQGVAKAFIDGARMVSILDERNIIADIDQLDARQGPRKELSSSEMPLNLFKGAVRSTTNNEATSPQSEPTIDRIDSNPAQAPVVPAQRTNDPVSRLFGLDPDDLDDEQEDDDSTIGESEAEYVPTEPTADSIRSNHKDSNTGASPTTSNTPSIEPLHPAPQRQPTPQPSVPVAYTTTAVAPTTGYSISISGPGLDTQLVIQDAEDLVLVSALLDKIRRQLR
ncbi:hypothetical protein [Hymenobacter fodinae]|uniref:Uncharacterized protein n=1 Tax=Hymenobacter fodinae TaxID=2510796 RepID=A0A4Z0P1V2_9BACT|nr:hypothetical protein [Hymenobacter fodinae]TGE04730.1 hypothetical protein EU556_21350 [Hymenobacter fodinae]